MKKCIAEKSYHPFMTQFISQTKPYAIATINIHFSHQELQRTDKIKESSLHDENGNTKDGVISNLGKIKYSHHRIHSMQR